MLKQAGHDVIGVTLNVWPDLPNMPEIQREDACCALGAVEDARRVADKLDIPYYVLNFREVFEDKVIKDFVKTYASGRTPNPCIRCNQFIKFDALLVKARQLGAEYVATGHYARIEHAAAPAQHRLRKAADPSKDQSYVLYVMSQDRLGAALMPLGDFTKTHDAPDGGRPRPGGGQQAREPGHLLRAVQALHRVHRAVRARGPAARADRRPGRARSWASTAASRCTPSASGAGWASPPASRCS